MPVGQSLDKGTADVKCELLEENHHLTVKLDYLV